MTIHDFVKSKFCQLSFVGVSASLVFLGSTDVAHAVTFSTDNGYALNTNNQFSKFDSYPRMSQYPHSTNDPDQQFDEIAGRRGGTLLRNRSTGMCINIHYGIGELFNTFPCNADDPDQNIRQIDGGGGAVLLQPGFLTN